MNASTFFFSRLLAALALWLGLALAACAQPLQAIPALSARVMDQTGTLAPAQTGELEAMLAALEKETGSQVAVLMVPTTAPEDIAAYANRVASAWKLGRKDVGDGVLIIVALHDRKMRIEVARALEGALPDIAAKRIISQQMAPSFRQGDYAGGLKAAISAVAARLRAEELPPPGQESHEDDESPVLGAFIVLAGVFLLRRLVSALLGRKKTALAALLTAGLVFYFTSNVGLAIFCAIVVWLLLSGGGSHLGGGGSGGGGSGGGGSGGGFGSGGSWGGSGGSFGGGFSSGGGGSFGGGGASGSW